MTKKSVLFLCTGNSCRSQMAEGWAKHFHKDQINAYSAGIAPQGLNPLACQVMKEAGVDINSQSSKHLDELSSVDFDLVVTVCGHADEHCPHLPSARQVRHVGFEDPPKLAEQAKDEEEALGFYRRVRDEIKEFVSSLDPTELA